MLGMVDRLGSGLSVKEKRLHWLGRHCCHRSQALGSSGVRRDAGLVICLDSGSEQRQEGKLHRSLQGNERQSPECNLMGQRPEQKTGIQDSGSGSWTGSPGPAAPGACCCPA